MRIDFNEEHFGINSIKYNNFLFIVDFIKHVQLSIDSNYINYGTQTKVKENPCNHGEMLED
jgi:hypothetical protein